MVEPNDRIGVRNMVVVELMPDRAHRQHAREGAAAWVHEWVSEAVLDAMVAYVRDAYASVQAAVAAMVADSMPFELAESLAAERMPEGEKHGLAVDTLAAVSVDWGLLEPMKSAELLLVATGPKHFPFGAFQLPPKVILVD